MGVVRDDDRNKRAFKKQLKAAVKLHVIDKGHQEHENGNKGLQSASHQNSIIDNAHD
jgi:hypothetical protein